MPGSSNYPTGYDTFPEMPATLDGTPTHEVAHENVNKAVEQIEIQLGLSPKGSDASVRARLDRIDGTLTAYSPAVGWASNGTNVVDAGWYRVDGPMVDVGVTFRLTGAPTAGTLTFSLPFDVHVDQLGIGAVEVGAVIGTCEYLDAGSDWGSMRVVRPATAVFGAGKAGIDKQAFGTLTHQWVTHLVPHTWASGDGASLLMRYRKA